MIVYNHDKEMMEKPRHQNNENREELPVQCFAVKKFLPQRENTADFRRTGFYASVRYLKAHQMITVTFSQLESNIKIIK